MHAIASHVNMLEHPSRVVFRGHSWLGKCAWPTKQCVVGLARNQSESLRQGKSFVGRVHGCNIMRTSAQRAESFQGCHAVPCCAVLTCWLTVPRLMRIGCRIKFLISYIHDASPITSMYHQSPPRRYTSAMLQAASCAANPVWECTENKEQNKKHIIQRACVLWRPQELVPTVPRKSSH